MHAIARLLIRAFLFATSFPLLLSTPARYIAVFPRTPTGPFRSHLFCTTEPHLHVLTIRLLCVRHVLVIAGVPIKWC